MNFHFTNEKNWDKNEEGGEKIVYVINHFIFRSFTEFGWGVILLGISMHYF